MTRPTFLRQRPRIHRMLALSSLLFFSACAMQTANSFDSTTWKSQRDVGAVDNKRGAMVAELEQTIRVGMPRAAVLALLGPPDAQSKDDSIHVYAVGGSLSGLDEEFYEITYRDDKVASYRFNQG